MMQCNHCGSSVFATDQFCMECGQPIQLPQAAAAEPGAARPTEAPAPNAAQPEETTACPNCAATLPRGARFCGDCGTPLSAGAAAVPASAPARPARVATAALPVPIPPLNANPAPRPPSGPVPAVLPPFQPVNWAAQAAPDVEIPDATLTPLSNAPAAPANQQAAAWANPPEPAPWGVPSPAPWLPGQPPGTSNAAEFSPPRGFPQAQVAAAPAPGPVLAQPAASPSQAFFQAMNAMPMAPALAVGQKPRKQRLPRGQVITMIVAAVVTVLAAAGGTILLLLPNK